MDMWQALDRFRREVIDNSSDEDESNETISSEFMVAAASMLHDHNARNLPVYRGSVKGRDRNIPRDRIDGQARLMRDYFHRTNPIFPEHLFRRRYRMSRELFLIILRGVRDYDPYFQCRPDATGALGFTSYQKCTAAIRMLSYGMAADIFDEYIRMGESTCLDSMHRFCRAVIAVFGEVYLRRPTLEDTRRLLSINESRGFPGMIGSIDCMHWEWKNCPFGWQGQFSGHAEGCTVILEAVISQDLWIWHSFFGMAGSNNDINVLHRSPVFNELMEGNAPQVSYEINGNDYDKPYYLADGIYPDWATLVKTFRNPNTGKTKRFAKMQEAARKDVEQGFGVLQARWAIVRHPARTWSLETMHEVMTCCVIMHNMIVEDEHPGGNNEHLWDFQGELVAPNPGASTWEQYIEMNLEVTDDNMSKRLQKDLIQHQWAMAGHQEDSD